jgi:hypothetical protein
MSSTNYLYPILILAPQDYFCSCPRLEPMAIDEEDKPRLGACWMGMLRIMGAI